MQNYIRQLINGQLEYVEIYMKIKPSNEYIFNGHD